MQSDDWRYVQPRAMGKAQLAELQGFNSAYYFHKLVHQNEYVMVLLTAVGYKKNQKTVTQKQCEIIFEHLGYPIVGEKQ